MEHAVILHLRLGSTFGSSDEQAAILALEKKLMLAIEKGEAGEFDGDEFGNEECVIYMYGPDADHLFSVIEPVLKDGAAPFVGYAIKRYGEAANRSAREVRVSW